MIWVSKLQKINIFLNDWMAKKRFWSTLSSECLFESNWKPKKNNIEHEQSIWKWLETKILVNNNGTQLP